MSGKVFDPFSLIADLFTMSAPATKSSLVDIVLFSSCRMCKLIVVSSAIVLFYDALSDVVQLWFK